MKFALLLSLLGAFLTFGVRAQERIYRCGNEYTNTAPNAQNRGCKLIEGGNVTVVQGVKPAVNAPAAVRPGAPAVPGATPAGGPRVDTSEQKSRDSDARQILESELKKAESRRAELLREYNNGEPEKRGDEARNQQKYQDRVAELKSSLARIESDIAGIRRELGRFGAMASLPAAK